MIPISISILTLLHCYRLWKRTDEKSINLRNRLSGILLAMTFIILPSVSIKVFATFVCHNFDDNTSFLKIDYTLSCLTGSHTDFILYATIMIIIFPFGIPGEWEE